MTNKEELMETKTLKEATTLLFNRISNGRDCIFTQEAMTGCVASEYDSLGKSGRQETYEKIAEDFKRRTGYYSSNHSKTSYKAGSILEVGCGSGLLTLELAEQTESDNIIGLDISEDMIKLAQSNLTRKSVENHALSDKITYLNGNVYDLQNIGLQNIDFIVCRNALHRFQYPEKALKQMYQVLSPGGKLYIRDLRRDANWQIVLERIGEKRWQTKTLVEDYIGAMASMLTTKELEKTLRSLGITSFDITDGRYINGEIKNPSNIKEYERDSEYVCVIRKRKIADGDKHD